MAETRMLYLLPGLQPPLGDPEQSKFGHLSSIMAGDVITPVWWEGPDDVRKLLGEGAYPVYYQGRFAHHFVFCPTHLSKPRQLWRRLTAYIRDGARILREAETPVVMTYGANVTGLAGVVLKWLTGAKLIIEVPGVPHRNHVISEPDPGLAIRLRQRISELLFVFVLRNADHAKLLYPQQLDALPSLRDKPRTVFHNLVRTRAIEPRTDQGEPFVLLLGHPWHRKGADILIRAFQEIRDEFPELTLKLVGWDLDRGTPKELAAGDPRIEFLGAVKHDEAMDLMGRCSIFVMASRSEAMGRVTLEAMAARRPIIGSAVDGIPHYIRDGFSGLLFEPENADDLADKMRRILRDPELAETLADHAYARFHAELDEAAFVRRFQDLLREVLPGELPQRKTQSGSST
jgi:glycosyltransferase involved in cell wall biosynthesis